MATKQKHADLIRDAVEKAESLLSGTNKTYREALHLNTKLQNDIKELESMTGKELAEKLAEVVQLTNKHNKTRNARPNYPLMLRLFAGRRRGNSKVRVLNSSGMLCRKADILMSWKPSLLNSKQTHLSIKLPPHF